MRGVNERESVVFDSPQNGLLMLNWSDCVELLDATSQN
jgi:hypothetical protein